MAGREEPSIRASPAMGTFAASSRGNLGFPCFRGLPDPSTQGSSRQVAKPKKQITAAPRSTAKALEELEKPRIKWKTLALFALGIGVIWIIAGILTPSIGYVGIAIAGVVTLIAVGFLLWIWRLTSRSGEIAEILKTATDKEGRIAALEQLKAKQSPGGKDALNAIAQSQLVAQESPAEAIRILENVDLKKAPALVHDDVRANLAMLYLMTGRARDARELADQVRLDRQPQARAKAMYAAVVAEAFARTGKAEDAQKLLETFDPHDKEYGQVAAMLLRAQVYTYVASKKRGRAREAMERLLAVDPNMVAAFVQRGARPELARLAKQVLAGAGALPKQKMRVKAR